MERLNPTQGDTLERYNFGLRVIRQGESLVKIGEVKINPNDSVIVVQRHQRPKPADKEHLKRQSQKMTESGWGVEYSFYDPGISDEGTSAQLSTLKRCTESFGRCFDAHIITPRKRGDGHKDLVANAFPQSADYSGPLKPLADDPELGPVGELLNGKNTLPWQDKDILPEKMQERFTRYRDTGQKTYTKYKYYDETGLTFGMPDWTYADVWALVGTLNKKNPMRSNDRVESVAELAKRILGSVGEIYNSSLRKSYLVTHEANCIALHMLATRTDDELKTLVEDIGNFVLGQVKSKMPGVAEKFSNEFRDSLRRLLVENEGCRNYLELYHRIEIEGGLKKAFHGSGVVGLRVKVLQYFLSKMRLQANGGKGYGALSVYVLRKNEGDRGLEVIEAAYDLGNK